MKHGYAVLGLGRQGTAAVYDLVSNCDAKRVVAFEPHADRRAEAKAHLGRVLGDDAGMVTYIDGNTLDWDSLPGQVDVVLSCAPYRFNVGFTEQCVRLKLPLCDLGGNPETVDRQQQIADAGSTPIVPECGLAPGIGNVLAVHMAREHHAEAVYVRCGGLPAEAPDPAENPLQYKLVFDPQGLVSEYSNRCPIIRHGLVDYVDALSDVEMVDELHESFPTSNNSPPVVEHLRELGVKEFDYQTIRYQGHFAAVLGWRTLGYLCGNAERDAELVKTLAADPVLRYDRNADRDKVILMVTGMSGDRMTRMHEYRIEIEADGPTGFTAMELSTCWGCTIVAHHIASGRGAPKGFATPERFVDTIWFIEELQRRIDALA